MRDQIASRPTPPDHRQQSSLPPYGGHLSDEQLGDLLLDHGTSAAQHHLDTCTLCQRELDTLRASVQDFNHLSLAWAEKRAPVHIVVPTHAALRWHALPAWSAVATAALVAIFVVGAHERQVQSSASNLVAEASAQASIVADDNRLLSAIDDEIRIGQQTPSDVFALGLTNESPVSGTPHQEN